MTGKSRIGSEDDDSHYSPSKKLKILLPCSGPVSDPQPHPFYSETTIHHLPDPLLVEILCRLPHCKFVCKCKLVSKHWCEMLSNLHFVSRFLHLQHHRQNPLLKSLVIVPQEDKKQSTFVLPITAAVPSNRPPPAFKTSILSFLPCYQHDHVGDEVDVVGIYNDLVLCCATWTYQRDYYICNVFSKKWIALPPTPRVYKTSPAVGFICEPYYSVKQDPVLKQDEKEQVIAASSSIQLTTDYRCRVVRILPNSDFFCEDTGFHLEIFFSETGEWREYQSHDLSCPHHNFHEFDKRGIAYNGKLWWGISDGNTFELDPLNIISTCDVIDKFRFIDAPQVLGHMCVSVCRGRLRMSHFNLQFFPSLSIWELKENPVDGTFAWCLIFDKLSFCDMVSKDPLIRYKSDAKYFVCFHPDDEDIVYLKYPKHIVMCNVREKSLEVATEVPADLPPALLSRVYQFICPWWPTPVPRVGDQRGLPL